MKVKNSWSAIEKRMPKGKGVRRVVSDAEPVFRISGNEWSATGRMTEYGFIVFAGSTVNHVCPSFRKDKNYFPLREECERAGIIKDDVFVVDYLFRSPCQAGTVIACHYVNTNKEWKTDDSMAATWGECHKRKEGEEKTYASIVPDKEKKDEVVLGWSEKDGMEVYTKEVGDKIVEYRGGCIRGAFL